MRGKRERERERDMVGGRERGTPRSSYWTGPPSSGGFVLEIESQG